MSIRGEPIDFEVELLAVMGEILKELKLIRLMIAEQNDSSLNEKDL